MARDARHGSLTVKAATRSALVAGVSLFAFSCPSFADPARTTTIALCPEIARPVVSSVRVSPSRVSPFYSLAGIPMRLEIRAGAVEAEGQTECVAQEFSVAAEEILWVGPVTQLDAMPPAPAVVLQGTFGSDKVAVSEIEWLGRTETPRESPSIPHVHSSGDNQRTQGATRHHTNPQLSPHSQPRSAWIWAPHVWRADTERIWKLAKTENLKELFVTVPVTNGVVEHSDELASFIRAAHRRGVAVWAVVGDPHDVLPEARAPLLARVNAYAVYNAGAPRREKLAGVQLDIEPYLLPGFALAPDYWREQYLNMFRAVHESVNERLPLDLVVPVWWGSHPAWGGVFMQGIARPGVSVTVMNYRTNPEALRAGALPFLEAGEDFRFNVRMAVETGPLTDETRRTYRTAEPGETAALWLTEVGSTPILILLAEPRSVFKGQGYAFSHETIAAARNLTFGPHRARREEVIRVLEKEWTGWKNFAGLAIHGLDVDFR